MEKSTATALFFSAVCDSASVFRCHSQLLDGLKMSNEEYAMYDVRDSFDQTILDRCDRDSVIASRHALQFYCVCIYTTYNNINN